MGCKQFPADNLALYSQNVRDADFRILDLERQLYGGQRYTADIRRYMQERLRAWKAFQKKNTAAAWRCHTTLTQT